MSQESNPGLQTAERYPLLMGVLGYYSKVIPRPSSNTANHINSDWLVFCIAGYLNILNIASAIAIKEIESIN